MDKNIFFEILCKSLSYVENVYNSEDYSALGAITVNKAKCNGSCSYCTNLSYKAAPDSVDLNLSRISEKLSAFKHKSGRVTIWCGEPLYNKETFIKLCECIKTNIPNAHLNTVTNGILLNDWWVSFFKDYDINVIVSHDGPGQKYRGVNYLNSDTCVKALQQMTQDGTLGCINTVIHKYNCDFSEIYSFFKNLEKEKNIVPKLYQYIPVMPNINNDVIYDFDYMDPLLIKFIWNACFESLKLYAENEKCNFFVTKLSKIANALIYHNESSRELHFKKCAYLTDVFYLDEEGNNCCNKGPLNTDWVKQNMEKHKASCTACDKLNLCDFADCPTKAIDQSLCLKIKNRLSTIEYAIKEIIRNAEYSSTI